MMQALLIIIVVTLYECIVIMSLFVNYNAVIQHNFKIGKFDCEQ